MADILQASFSNVFCYKEMLGVQLTIRTIQKMAWHQTSAWPVFDHIFVQENEL